MIFSQAQWNNKDPKEELFLLKAHSYENMRFDIDILDLIFEFEF